MCESFRPGITVRFCPSITSVCGLRKRSTSSSLPAAVIFPAVMATAWTNEGTPFVAILALCNMSSADTKISFPLFQMDWEGRRGLRPWGLLVRRECNGNSVLGEFRGRRAVHHGVRVLDTDPVCSVVILNDIHHCIVGSAMRPIALPFEHDLQGRDRFPAG